MKVAIIGYGEGRLQAPFDDPAWECWGLNGAHVLPGGHWRPDQAFCADRWFQLHPFEGCDVSELDWMARGDVPTYVWRHDLAVWQARYPVIPLVEYPLEDVQLKFPLGWFANTFCLEVALALTMGADAIGLYGTECTHYGRELTVERPALAWWLGAASALGVDVKFPDETTLFYPDIYGFDYWGEARKAAELTDMMLPALGVLRHGSVNLDSVAKVNAAYDRVHGLKVK